MVDKYSPRLVYRGVAETRCHGRGFCVDACPYNAIELKEVECFGHVIEVATVNEALCKGCGLCSATCLNGAIQHHGLKNDRIFVIKISRKNMYA